MKKYLILSAFLNFTSPLKAGPLDFNLWSTLKGAAFLTLIPATYTFHPINQFETSRASQIENLKKRYSNGITNKNEILSIVNNMKTLEDLIHADQLNLAKTYIMLDCFNEAEKMLEEMDIKTCPVMIKMQRTEILNFLQEKNGS